MTEWNQLSAHDQEHANQVIDHLNEQDHTVLAHLKSDIKHLEAWVKKHPKLATTSGLAIAYVFKRLKHG